MDSNTLVEGYGTSEPTNDGGKKVTKKKKKKNNRRKKKNLPEQIDPLSIPVLDLFPSGDFPAGEIQQYEDHNLWKITSEEKRELERQQKPIYNSVRQAAEVHRKVRAYMKEFLKPGMLVIDMCEKLETTVRKLISENGLQAGIAIPTDCSLNWAAAYWTPNKGDKTVLQYDDVMKLHFGTHVDGYIVDCAYTVAFMRMFHPLLEASREATDRGIKNMNGHKLGRHQLYAGKSVPTVRGGDQTKMEEGEIYAIKSYGSTGEGLVTVREDLECSHYMKYFDVGHVHLKSHKARQLLATINKNFSTLPFCRRYLDRLGETNYLLALKELCDSNIVKPYHTVCDAEGSYVSHHGHTIMLRPTCKEVLSKD